MTDKHNREEQTMKLRGQVKVARMGHIEHHGDWHDKPCKWEVIGPNTERQVFSTRKDAELYAKCRRNSESFMDGQRKWMATA